MRNAWGQFDGVQRLGLGSLVFTLLYATLVGCDPLTIMEESDPSKLSIVYSGCYTVQEGPVCELPKLGAEQATTPLTLHIERESIPTITIETAQGLNAWTEAECSEETCARTEAGYRIVLPISASAREVLVKSGNPDINDWTLSIINFQERPAVMSDAVALEQSSRRDEALQLLETALPTLAPHWQAEAMSHVARMYKRLGKADEALQSFEQSMDLHLQTGGLSHYVKDGTAAVHTLIMDAGMQLNQARDLASSLRGILPQHYESQHFYHWASLFAANKAHEHQETLYHGQRGIRLAQQMNHSKFATYLVPFFTHALQKLGRFDDAIETLEAKTHLEHPQSCVDAENLNTLGFIRWFAHQSDAERATKGLQLALKNFSEAVKIASEHCTAGHNQHEQVNGHINLALAYLSLGQLASATKALDQIPQNELRHFHHEWLYQTRAEIALASKDAERALSWFKKLKSFKRKGLSPYLKLRVLLGSARAYAQMGSYDLADQSWFKAQQAIKEEGLLVPIHDGREIFLAQYQNATRDYVETALENGELTIALRALRSAHAQLLQSVQWQDRIQNLNEAERLQWQANLGHFQQLRKDLEELRKSSWTIPTTLKDKHNAELVALEAQTASALHQTLQGLGFSPTNQLRDRSLKVGELELTYFQGRDGWLSFVRSSTGLKVVRLSALEMDSDPKNLGKLLLQPLSDSIRAATAISILPTGKLSEVDFHSLKIDGKTLIELAPVTYQTGIPYQASQKPSVDLTRAVVVADPSGNLSQARQEASYAQEVLQRMSGGPIDTLEGSEVTVTRLKGKLMDGTFLHYAGHGVFDDTNASRSALLLANDTRLDLKDILALPSSPETVVLSACDTAKTDAQRIFNHLGIAQSFLSAGSSRVIAAARPVDDEVGNQLMVSFYKHLEGTKDLAASLQQAQIETMTKFPGSDWATYRLITRN